jgi:hypothetical protein
MRTAIAVGIFIGALALATTAGAALVSIYRNNVVTVPQKAQLVKLSGRNCARGGSKRALRVVIGKRTPECAYRIPVVGRDLEIAATERLLSGTPKRLRRRMFLAVNLRAGGRSKYQLAVLPLQKKVLLRKYESDGSIKYLAIAKSVRSVAGINAANQLRLRAFNIAGGPERGQCRLLALVGGKLVANVVDPSTSDLSGRTSAVSVGSTGSATRAVASFSNVVVRVPSPF